MLASGRVFCGKCSFLFDGTGGYLLNLLTVRDQLKHDSWKSIRTFSCRNMCGYAYRWDRGASFSANDRRYEQKLNC